MNKIILIIGTGILLLSTNLSGCINVEYTSDDQESDYNNDDFGDDWDTEVIEITSMGTEQTINYLNKPVDLVVTGMNCIVTVTKGTDLKEVTVTGMNSVVRVSKSHSFISTITGMNAKIVYYD